MREEARIIKSCFLLWIGHGLFLIFLALNGEKEKRKRTFYSWKEQSTYTVITYTQHKTAVDRPIEREIQTKKKGHTMVNNSFLRRKIEPPCSSLP
jgi:hypothetical protein